MRTTETGLKILKQYSLPTVVAVARTAHWYLLRIVSQFRFASVIPAGRGGVPYPATDRQTVSAIAKTKCKLPAPTPASQRAVFVHTFETQRRDVRNGSGPSDDRGVAAARRPKAAHDCGADGPWRRLRRYRHEPALWTEAGRRRRWRPRARDGDGCRVADLLGPVPDRRVEIRHSDPARR